MMFLTQLCVVSGKAAGEKNYQLRNVVSKELLLQLSCSAHIKIVIITAEFIEEKIRRYLTLTLSIFDYFILRLRFLVQRFSNQC